jgi:hypothetical protein
MFEGKICPKLGPIFHHNIPKYSFRILEVMWLQEVQIYI